MTCNIGKKKFLIRKIFTIALWVFMGVVNAQAQLHMKTTLQNMILWRGIEVADGLILSSDLSVSDPSGMFAAGFLGGANTKESYKELSQYIAYTHGRFQIKVIDTYNFSPGVTYNNNEFFNYKPDETGRFMDLMVNYTGNRKFPLELSLSTLIYGRDRDLYNSKNIYSSFVYVGYTIYQNEKLKVGSGVGTAFALRNSRNESGEMVNRTMYAESAGITQVSLNVIYKLQIMEYEIPLTVMTYWNPKSNQGFFYTGMQFNLF